MTKTRKLGDLLIEAGLINARQLDQALQAQLIFGGRLGTNLIEMNAVDEDTLAGFLSTQLGVPRIDPARLEKIPADIISRIPAKAAQRLCILPVEETPSGLVVAMLDPSDDRVLKRLESNLQRKILPVIAMEIEIRFFLEKYYGVPRETRHIQLMNQILEHRQKGHAASTDALGTALDAHVPMDEAIPYFFEHIGSLEHVPVREMAVGLTKLALTPEMMFVLSLVDGILSLNDIFSMSPFRRASTLRAFVHFAREGWVRFENPYDTAITFKTPKP